MVVNEQRSETSSSQRGPVHPGAIWDGRGVTFAVFSQHASAVELCLFDAPTGEVEVRRIGMVREPSGLWVARVDGARAGQLYGFRAYGPYRPDEGHRFNPNKLLLDPYARAVAGGFRLDESLLGYIPEHAESDLSFHAEDSARVAPKARVVDPAFDWGDDAPPRTPWRDSVVYECHVKGMTASHPEIPAKLRGTYLGLASAPIVQHLQKLGVSAVELLPVQHFVDQREVMRRGLTNYWGYNTVGFFAPEARYASGDDGRQVVEFKRMVRAFHRAGIEVILDVVYNHTGEGDEFGPTLCFRGLDNAVYYRPGHDGGRRYDNVTGCGNTLNLPHPRVFQLVMDSLRYWVTDMHVDGFRLDLTPALLRGPHGVDPHGALSLAVSQDPVLSAVKWIAEPWDLGHGGYQLGRFPHPWAEWNDKYRDTMRSFWRGDAEQVAHLSGRLAGSSDLFAHNGRGPLSSMNFVACHDGFTLADLVSYENKHNEANGEGNRDGTDQNFSRNWGVEGPTERPEVVELREQAKRNLLATLVFSLGVPMLSHGDEIGRTQNGNNNAWCQDSELSWLDWKLDAAKEELLNFTRRVLAIRRQTKSFRRETFFDGRTGEESGLKDVRWLREDGEELNVEDWHSARRHVLGMLAHEHSARRYAGSDGADRPSESTAGKWLLLLLNAGANACHFTMPVFAGTTWRVLVDTSLPEGDGLRATSPAVDMRPRSLVLLEGRAS